MGNVLISTYWNVKDRMVKMYQDHQHVLISTYWNVKQLLYAVVEEGDSFNLNLLECKD